MMLVLGTAEANNAKPEDVKAQAQMAFCSRYDVSPDPLKPGDVS